MADCPTCGIIVCPEGSDLELFSLQSEIFPFVLNCPTGYDCLNGDSFTMICCGQRLSVSFAPDSTQEQRIAAVADVLRRCVTASRSCTEGGVSTQNPQAIPLVPISGTVSPTSPPSQSNPFRLYYNRPQTATTLCPDGSTFSYTFPTASLAAGSQAVADQQAMQLAQQQAPTKQICMSGIAEAICVDVARTINIGATGPGLATYPAFDFWQVVGGSIPPGMTFNGGAVTWPGKSGTSKATLTGTPTTSGLYSFTVRVTGPGGQYQQKAYLLTVTEIIPTTFTDPTVGVPYSLQLTLNGYGESVLWSVSSGALPAGLTLNATTGLVSGTPTADWTSAFTVRAEMEDGVACQREYTPPTAPILWWKLEEVGAVSRFDAVDNVELPAFINAPNSGTGIIGNGAQVVFPGSNAGLFNATPPFGNLAYTGQGMTLCGWLRYSGYGTLDPITSQFNVSWSDGFHSFDLRFVHPPAGGHDCWFVIDGNVYTVSAVFTPTPGAWHFFRVFYDPATQEFGISMDNGPEYRAAAVFAPVAPGTVSLIYYTWNDFGGLPVTIDTDEIAIIAQHLSPAQASYLYNGGAGRTWPVTLP